MPFSRAFLLFAALALPFGTVRALDWNETLNGDLSDDGAAPTLVGTLSSGSNLFTGTMGSLGGVGAMDADIWTFTIAAGYYLTGINLVGYTSASGGNNDSFMAISIGSSIETDQAVNHLSNALWNQQLDGFGNTYTDLFALLDGGPDFGGIGFDGPLSSGNYTFWVQEGSDQISYQIDFVTSPIPVPEPGGALLLGMAGLWCLRRRR